MNRIPDAVANATPDPVIPPALRRPLAAIWISLGLHAALIGLVHLSPPAGAPAGPPVIEARLVSTHASAAPSAAVVPPAVPEPSKVPPPPDAVPVKQVPALSPPPPPAVVASASPAPVAPQPAGPSPISDVPPAPAPAPGTLTSTVDLTYYSARDLDVQPRALRDVVPGYPDDADQAQLSGKVRLQLKLEADGRVTDVRVVSATPPGRFEESAIKAFREARFSPAQKNGRPVRALVVIEVVYDWYGQPRR